MGCCSSKKKVEAPKKVAQTETDRDSVSEYEAPIRKNIEIKSSLDHQDLNKEKPLRVGVNPIELAKKRTEQEKKLQIKEEQKPKLSREEHAKILALVEKKYKNFLSLLVFLRDNLLEHEQEEDETLEDIIKEIGMCCAEIEKHLETLRLYPFPNDKERLQEFLKAINFTRILNTEFSSYRKGKKTYSYFRKKILALLEELYPFLFEGEEEVPLPDFENPHSEVSKRSPIKNDTPKKLTSYDIAFDREMAIVMQRERDNAVFELESAVNEYNRLIEDINRLKQREQNLHKDYVQVRQEVKELKNMNSSLAYNNEMLGVENQTFQNIQSNMIGNYDLTKESCLQLQNELDMLHKQAQNNYMEKQYEGREYQSKIRELENKAFERRREANELERRYQEDIRRLFNKEDEVQYQKSRFIDGSQLALSRPFEAGNLYSAYDPRRSLANELEQVRYNNQIAQEQRMSQERASRRSKSPRKSVLDQQEGNHLQDVITAVDQVKKAREETDQSWVGSGLESKRLELYFGIPKENESRMSTLSGTLNSGLPKAYQDGYYNDGNVYGSTYNQRSYEYRNGGRESIYRVEIV